MKIIDKVAEKFNLNSYEKLCARYIKCPSEYGFKDIEEQPCKCEKCSECWNREV